MYGAGGLRGVIEGRIFLFVSSPQYNSIYRTKLTQRDINIALLTEHSVEKVIFDLVQDAVHERFWSSEFFKFSFQKQESQDPAWYGPPWRVLSDIRRSDVGQSHVVSISSW